MIAQHRTVVRYAILFMLLFISQSISAGALLEKQRNLYAEIEQVLKQGQRTLFVKHQKSLRNYPLYPYLLYLDMTKRFAYLKSDTIVEFLNRYDATPIADKLRDKWLKYLATQNDRRLFAQHYQDGQYSTNNALACFYAHSLLHTQRIDELRDLTRQLWLVGFSQPPECDAIFRWGKQTAVINQDLIWQRILLVVKSNNLKLADHLAKQLSNNTRTWYTLLKQSHYHPFKTLGKIADYQKHSPFLHEILLHSLSQAQGRDLNKTHAIWQNLKSRFKPYTAVYEKAAEKLGIAACRQLQPKIGLYYLLSITNLDQDLYYWRIRCALRLQKWKIVLANIDALDEDHINSKWLYWKARAFAQLGNTKGATAIWKSIASEASYYGYLAADWVGQAYALSTKLPTINRQHAKEIEDLPSMKRIYEFFKMARIFDARRELLYLLPQMNENERLAIALLCRQWGWATGAIDTLSIPKFWHQELELRFPMKYHDIVAQQAGQTDLSAHWIYAVIRRESAFIKDAKSPAGALGLMQLMPKTASRTAKRLGLNYASTWSLLQPKLNIQLGSHYLKYMYRLNDHNWILALASYNAGHHRVKQWKRDAAVANADIWIETIPFTETRRYVRAVLFYAVVYYYKLHHKTIHLSTLTRPINTSGSN